MMKFSLTLMRMKTSKMMIIVLLLKRRTISSISKFNWGNLGSTELDTAAITAMRRESVSMFEVGVCFPSPLDTSLQDLDKMF